MSEPGGIRASIPNAGKKLKTIESMIHVRYRHNEQEPRLLKILGASKPPVRKLESNQSSLEDDTAYKSARQALALDVWAIEPLESAVKYWSVS